MSKHYFETADGTFWTGKGWGTKEEAIKVDMDDFESLPCPNCHKGGTLYKHEGFGYCRSCAPHTHPDALAALRRTK